MGALELTVVIGGGGGTLNLCLFLLRKRCFHLGGEYRGSQMIASTVITWGLKVTFLVVSEGVRHMLPESTLLDN